MSRRLEPSGRSEVPDRSEAPGRPEVPDPHTTAERASLRADGALHQPRAHPTRIAAGVWHLEAVRGIGDAEVARIAELQRGILARSQLIQAGLSAGAIKHRLQVGQLHVLYPGVYLFGRPRLEPLAAATAAVTYANGRGVLSHRTAAIIWKIVGEPESPVELTVRASQIRSRPGLTVRRPRTFSRADVRQCQRLPVTSPARTLLDLAGVLRGDELEAAYTIALRRGLVTKPELLTTIERAPWARGIATLRALMQDGAGPTLTRSKYERKLRDLIRRAELPKPRVNAIVEGMEVDFCWPQARLVVEFDGFAYHSDRRSFEGDRLRDQRLIAAGYRVIRITARQLDQTPEAVIARIAAALAQ